MERSNIFEMLIKEGEDGLVFAELQPAQPSTSPVIHSLQPAQANSSTYDGCLEHACAQQEIMLSPVLSEMGEQQEEMFESNNIDGPHHESVPQWMPDDEEDEPDNVPSSDESSDGEEVADILNQSEPKIEEEQEDDFSMDGTHTPVSLSASSNVVLSKKGNIVWSQVPVPQVGRTPTRNVFRPAKSSARYPKKINSILSAFQLIFTASIISDIVKMTNLEGKRNQGIRWKLMQ